MRETAAERRQELARRWALAREPAGDNAHGPRWQLLLAEAAWVAEPMRRLVDPPVVLPAARPYTAMLLPGFGAHPWRMRYLARQLRRAGHRAVDWGQGTNLGVTADRFAAVEQRLAQLHREAGEPVVLIGWSLGGVIARELAKRHPAMVAKVVTMGSPFSGSPHANNAWRLYQAIAGHRVEEPPIEAHPASKPPVETIALWSSRDGIVDPRSARGRPEERDRQIGLRCTHIGFVHSRAAIEAILRELVRD